MENKGFTLIELLSVLFILALIATLAVRSVFKIINKSRENIYLNQIYDILDSAYDYSLKYNDVLPNTTSPVKYITLAHLIHEGLIDSNIVDPTKGDIFDYSLVISISYVSNEATADIENRKYGNYLYKIEKSKTNVYSYSFDSSFNDFTIPLNDNYTLPNVPNNGIRIITKNNKLVDNIDTSSPDIYEVTDVVLSQSGDSISKTIKVAIST